MKYTCINIQGNLISEEILQKIEQGNTDGQLAKDFGLESGTNLRSEIEYAWSRIKLDWKHFSERTQNLPANDPYGTTLSRKWMNNFLSSLNFELTAQRTALQGENSQTYSISHTADSQDGLPVHIVGFYEPSNPDKNTLDIKSSGGTSRMSPHGTVQEYLNVTEHLYGIATNGITLRLIRDSGRLVKLTYVEFDLKRMLEEDKYSEFTLLYRLLHSTRFPRNKQEVDQCLLEKYYQDSIETGNRIRDGLSRAVKESLLALGQGFLQHPHNTELRQKLESGKLSSKDFYRQLLRLIYRFLFLMVTEERDLVYDPEDRNEVTLHKKRIYQLFYSIARLRKLSQNRYVYEAQFNDLWQGLVQTFQLFEEGGKGKKLGIEPLAGDLFHESAIRHLENCLISNQLLLECIRNMNEFEDERKNLVPINYRSLDVEELGSVYEGLLELHPVIENLDATNAAQINFTFHEGTDRKTTGSYYTRPDLVHELIKSALIPVIEERLKEFTGNRDAQANALLKLKVCDAAAGSGHMLLAAARTIAWYLARVLTGEENPAPGIYRESLRNVIQHCIYAVDMNPDAVELCKLALWLESHNSGKPLSFLDHKIRNGNSLVGVTDLSFLQKGIPNDAFNAITGDDKEVCKLLKKENQPFLKYLDSTVNIGFQKSLEFDTKNEGKQFSTDYHELENIKQDNIDAVKKVKNKFAKLRSNTNWYKDWTACNLWTSAFFFDYTEENKPSIPNSERLQSFLRNPSAAYSPMIGKANAMAEENKFFHWPLEFPDVFEQGGFDVMLGNPPWERIKLQAQEFFASRDPLIANSLNKSARESLIKMLPDENPKLYNEFISALHHADALGKFFKGSGRYKLTASGDINTYSVFSELYSTILTPKGRAGFIVPTGIATDDSNKVFFGALVEKNRIVSLYDFENREAIFQDVHRSYKFCLLTIGGYDIELTKAHFGFFLTRVEHLQDKLRIFSLGKEDFLRLNPNTKTCPIFRTSIDAQISSQIYRQVPIVLNERTGESSWDIRVRRLFDVGNPQVSAKISRQTGDSTFNSIIESKMLWQFDHRFSTYENLSEASKAKGSPQEVKSSDKSNAHYTVVSRNRLNEFQLPDIAADWFSRSKWCLGYRDVTGATNERTLVSFIFPAACTDFTVRVQFSTDLKATESCLLLCNYNSLILDYICRQKLGGMHISDYIFYQLPVLSQEMYDIQLKHKIIALALDLIYTSWDIKAFADDLWKDADTDLKVSIQQQWQANQVATGGHVWNPPAWAEQPADPSEPSYTGCPLAPFKWDEERRAVLKAELDAIYAKLYGLTTEELRYILDPQDVYGPDFPGETFRVLKEKEIRLYGEYRTRRLVLEAWDKLNGKSKTEIIHLSPPLDTTMIEFKFDAGIFSIPDVCRISGLSASKVRRWFKDLQYAHYEGLKDDRNPNVDHWLMSFHGLIELVVIDKLRDAGVTLKNIFTARANLKKITKKHYPFASQVNIKKLHATGKVVTFNLEDDIITLDGTSQFNLKFIQEFFLNIEFEADIAKKLFLNPTKTVVADPKKGGGKPTITGTNIWVDTIKATHGAGETIEAIQDEYKLTKHQVEAALEYCN